MKKKRLLQSNQDGQTALLESDANSDTEISSNIDDVESAQETNAIKFKFDKDGLTDAGKKAIKRAF